MYPRRLPRIRHREITLNDVERWLMAVSICTHWGLLTWRINQPDYRYLTVIQAWRKMRGID